MTMERSLAVLAACLLSAGMPAIAMQPSDVYALVSPSVWKVATYDADGLPLRFGSGVVIAPDTLVTNCHVLAKAKRVVVRHDKATLEARLELWDPQRDVCQIKVTNLPAPSVSLGDVSRLRVGQNVYAIGNPKGLDLTMSAGLLSSIRRNEQDQAVLLQTSAAISGGSSGGGLFDENGVLIGLTTIASVTGDAQNLNFAIPVDWIRALPERHARLSKPAISQQAAASAATLAARTDAPVPATAAPNGDYARIDDVDMLPHVTDRMRDRYRVFLSQPTPRAFAISEGGKWSQAWGTRPQDHGAPADPSQRALQDCERQGAGRCFLYAVDDRVVYHADSTQ
jgi:S1-C subfamily serine protease